MLPSSLLLLCLTALHARAQSDSSSTTSSTRTTSSRAPERTNESTDIGTDTRSFLTISAVPSEFTGSQYVYSSYDTSQSRYIAETYTLVTGSNSSSSNSQSQVTVTSTSVSLTQLVGSTSTGTATNATASSTTSSAFPSNTVPCNNHPEFCNRKYSNITEVAAHNAAFVVKNNAASNQMLNIQDQLNDGIRMLTGETRLVNDTIYNCHTSCDLLNAGPWQDELEVLADWLDTHPYDVVTVLIVNSMTVGVGNYTPAIQNSGIAKYAYTPEYVPQHRDQWPTLGEMILKNQRVVFFMDYEADQSVVPYILDEFTHIFETPFSPTNQSFPCTKQRPPEDWTTVKEANETFMYLANHNLNTAIEVAALGFGSGDPVLIPNTAEINITNSDGTGFGELGAMNDNCTELWARPPNFLLVDYYNLGNFPGSVFEVAARANKVSYTRDCCGVNSNAAPPSIKLDLAALAAAAVAVVVMMW